MIGLSQFTFLALALGLMSGCATLADAEAAKGTGTTKTYAVEYDLVWNAVLEIVKSSDLQLVADNKEKGSVLAQRALTEFSWGENVADRRDASGGRSTPSDTGSERLRARRYGMHLWASTGCLRRPPRRARVFRRLHALLRDRANPRRSTLSRAPAWASSEVASLRPRGTRAAGPWGRPWPPPGCAPRGHSGQRRVCVDPPRSAPRGFPGFQCSSSPDRRPHRVVNPRDQPDFRRRQRFADTRPTIGKRQLQRSPGERSFDRSRF